MGFGFQDWFCHAKKSRLEIEKDIFTVQGFSNSTLGSIDQTPVISLGPRFCIQPLFAEAPGSIRRLIKIIIKKKRKADDRQ